MAADDIKIGVSMDADDALSDFQKLGAASSKMATAVEYGFDKASRAAWEDMNRMSDAVQDFSSDAQRGFSEAAAAASKFASQTSAAGKGADRSMRSFQGASANITAQFQDIAVQAQQGTNVMTIALQQGTQLAGVFATMGKEGGNAFKLIGSALKDLLGWQSLLVLGAVAAAAAFIQWMLQFIPKANDAKDALKAHKEAIDAISDAWPDAAKGGEKYLFVLKEIARQKAQTDLVQAQTNYNEELGKTGGLLKTNGSEIKQNMEFFKGQKLPAQLSWENLMASVASGEKTWREVGNEIINAANAEGLWKTMNAGTTNTMVALIGELDSLQTGVHAADVIMSKFTTDLLNGKENILGTYQSLVTLRDSLPQGEARAAVQGLIDKLTDLAQRGRELAAAGGNVHQFADGIDRLTSRQKVQERAAKTAADQQEKYNDALADMAKTAKTAENASRKQLEIDRDRAIVTAHTVAQQEFARKEYDKQVVALNALLGAERARANFLAELANNQEIYNASLEKANALVPAMLQSTEQQIEALTRLAQAHAADKEGRDAAATAPVLKQLTDNTAYNAIFAQVEKLKAELPTVTLTLQQQANQWLLNANAGQTNATVIAENIRVYNQLTGSIQQVTGAQATLGTQLSQLANTAFPGLNGAIQYYAQQVQSGAMSGEEFVYHLRLIAQNAPTKELHDSATAAADMGQAALDATGGVDALGNSADLSTSKVIALGQAAQITGQQLQSLLLFSAGVAAKMGAGISAATQLAEAAVIKPILTTALERQKASLAELRDIAVEGALLRHDTAAEFKATSDYEKGIVELDRQAAGMAAAAAAKKAASGGGGKGGGAGAGSKMDFAGQSIDLEDWSRKMMDAVEPTRVLAREQEILAAAVKDGWLTQEQAILVNKKLVEQYGQAATATFDLQKEFGNMMMQWGDQVASSLASAIVNGEDLGEVFKKLLLQLAEMALQMLVLKPLMGSIMGAFGVAPMAAAAPIPPPAANSNFRLPAPGMLGSRNATVGSRSSSGATTASMGDMTINFNGMGDTGDVKANGQRAKAMGERLRSVVQGEMIRQSRPGGLMWGGGGGRR